LFGIPKYTLGQGEKRGEGNRKVKIKFAKALRKRNFSDDSQKEMSWGTIRLLSQRGFRVRHNSTNAGGRKERKGSKRGRKAARRRNIARGRSKRARLSYQPGTNREKKENKSERKKEGKK